MRSRVEPQRGQVDPRARTSNFLDAVRKALERTATGPIEGGLKIYTTLDPRMQELAVVGG